MRRFLLTLVMAMAALVSGVGVASAAPSDAASAASLSAASAYSPECKLGYVCIYEGDYQDPGGLGRQVAVYYRYGVYNLNNLIGDYTVQNCQTGGASVIGYSGYNGTGSVLFEIRGYACGGVAGSRNLTPVNSIRLIP